MKKLILLLLIVTGSLSITTAQTQAPCIFTPSFELWNWDNWPTAVYVEGTLDYDPSLLNGDNYSGLIEAMFKNPNASDTTVGATFWVEEITPGHSNIRGNFTQTSYPFSGEAFQLAVRMVYYNLDINQVDMVYVSDFLTIQSPLTTGINTNAVETFKIFPNPATTHITVNSQEDNVIIYDIIGKQIKEIPTNIAVKIELPHGQYYVREEKNGKSKKFTVQ